MSKNKCGMESDAFVNVMCGRPAVNFVNVQTYSGRATVVNLCTTHARRIFGRATKEIKHATD